MTQAILNPVDLQPLLSAERRLLPAEEKFARCLGKGNPYMVGNGELPRSPIIHGDSANVVRAEVIRFFAYGGDSDKRPVLGSEIRLQGAWISEDLDLAHVNIPYALLFGHCHFANLVVMQHAGCAALYLDGSCLAKGLEADGLTTQGNVHLHGRFSAKGEVRLLGADIGGSLGCAGGEFHNQGGKALTADGLKTKGSVNLRGGFSAEGEVRLLGAAIGGDLDCAGGEFHNQGGNALTADGLTTKGGVFLRDGYSAEGEVRLLGAAIGGNLDCVGGEFHNQGGNALTADGLTTKGSVNLRDGFSADGEVCLLGADIDGQLDCTGGKFHNPKRYALIAESAKIGGGLLWRQVSGEGVVHLASAKAGVLTDELDSWKPFKVVLDGFAYDQFTDPTDANSRIEWLAMRPGEDPFSPLPYEQAAKVLFGMGHAREARKILLEKERRQTADERTKQPRKFLRQLWDVFAGYGYRLRYTAAWMAGFVLAGAGFFGAAAHHDQIVPHQPAILASEKYQAALGGNTPMAAARAAFPAEYPEFTPLAYSLDVFIPLFALHQEPFWSPAAGGRDDLWKSSLLLALFLAGMSALAGMTWFFSDWIRRETGDDFAGARSAGFGMAVVSLLLGFALASGFAHVVLDCDIPHWLADWRWLTVWYWLEIGFGWILTSLFLLSVTGVLRPRQSSGEKG